MASTLHTYVKKYQVFALPALAGGVMVILSAVVLVPKAQQIFEERSQLSQKQELLTNLTEKENVLGSVDQAKLVQTLSDVTAALPGEKDAASILVGLENIGATSGLSVDSINVSPGEVSSSAAALKPGVPNTTEGEIVSIKGSNALLVTVGARGNTAQFEQFLSTLETARRLFDISKVSVSYSTDVSDALTASFSIYAYYLPEITNLGKVDAPLVAIVPAEQKVIDTVSAFTNYSALGQGAGAAAVVIGKSDLFSQ